MISGYFIAPNKKAPLNLHKSLTLNVRLRLKQSAFDYRRGNDKQQGEI